MSIKIHHGPPGTYKTSGAVQDDFIPAARAGRHVVTNVRGLDDAELVKEVLGGVPEEFEITHVDTTTEANREHFRRWFHWCPPGAMIIIDEVNTIYPKGWGPKELAKYDYPGGVDGAREDKRAANVVEAFEMHRHLNFDVIVTSPAWSKVHHIIQDCAEGGYRHVNRKTVGLSGYIEVFHLGDNSGKAKSDEILFTKKRIKRRTFQIYRSTATGVVADTIAGTNVFASAKFLGGVGAIGAAFAILLWMGPPKALQAKGGEIIASATATDRAAQQNAAAPSVAPGLPGGKGAGAAGVPVVRNKVVTAAQSWLRGQNTIYYEGEIAGRHLVFVGSDSATGYTYQSAELQAIGVKFARLGRCFARLTVDGDERLINCRPNTEKRNVIQQVQTMVMPDDVAPVN